MKKFETNTVLQQSAKVFDDESAAPEEIAVACEKALVEMYNGKKNESLNALRKRKYCEKVAKSLHRVEGKSLPLPQLLQNFTVTKSIYKFVNEKILIAICRKNHGVGSSLIQDTPLY